MGNELAKSASSFAIHVTTGDRKCAGTNATVYIRLYDQSNRASEPIILNNKLKNDFQKGGTDSFVVLKEQVENLAEDADISCIEIWKDDVLISDDWMVDTITVDNGVTNKKFVFPVLRWISDSTIYKIQHLDTCLPKADKFPEQRKGELANKRKKYEYEQKIEGAPVQVKTLPSDEEFSFSYTWELREQGLRAAARSTKLTLFCDGEFENLEEIEEIYDDFFPPPRDTNGWKSDVFFGYQRTASHNPAIIKLATEIPNKFPVTDAMIGELLEGLTIKDAIARKRLFICDYEIMEGIHAKENMTVCHPLGLFFVNKKKELLPVAIQLFQKPGANNPIFTPKDSDMLWRLVKMWFNNADSAVHQAITHLGYTHLMMEGFAVATHRCISLTHPIFKILAPHFLYIININASALQTLIPEGGWIDTNMNPGSAGIKELLLKGDDIWNLNIQGTLPNELESRGLDDDAVLPNYHYREDASDLYEAINNYVTDYVKLYYSSNEVLKADHEIQLWVHELAKARSQNGVGLKGVPESLTSIEQLIEIVTCAIFTCSVVHGAVNFPQYDQYCYPPNCPLYMKGSPPTSKNATVTENDILKALPDRPRTLQIMSITKLLSTKGTRSLGDFEVQYIYDPEALKIVERFRNEIATISTKIQARNQLRKYTYDYLDPKFVPNSISI